MRIAAPLTELTKETVKFDWTSNASSMHFVTLKNAMQTAPILAITRSEVTICCSYRCIRFCCWCRTNQDQGKGLQPIAFLSKKMLDAETRYPVHEQELLAIIHAFSSWRHYLHGLSSRVMTDHHSLQLLQDSTNLSGRQSRWKDVIADFDFDIEYIEGRTNLVADGLSRRPDHQFRII